MKPTKKKYIADVFDEQIDKGIMGITYILYIENRFAFDENNSHVVQYLHNRYMSNTYTIYTMYTDVRT